MAQETRKDPRAKVLTVTVRYKSATLDEFIEHHSHDVSRGGMFIKTVSPFPAGTLLKIEVRIAGDQRVMQGVGRVVWKRESGEAHDGAPAGMGVKFIKIDDASRGVIDQLVAKSGGAVSAFERGGGEPAAPADAPAEPPVAAAKIRKATMIGLGALGADGAAKGDEPKDEKPSAAGAFFPGTSSEADLPPPEDRTVMKQAAELLQDALREAGGSMDEVGTPAAASSSSVPPPRPIASDAPTEIRTLPSDFMSEQAEKADGEASDRNAETEKPAAAKANEKAAASLGVAKAGPAAGRPAASRSASASSPRAPASRPSSRPPAAGNRRVSVSAEEARPEGASGGKMAVIVLAVAAVGAGLFMLSKSPSPAPAEPPAAEPMTPPAPAAATTVAPVETAVPAETAAPAEPTASAAPSATPSALPQVPSAAPAATAALAPSVIKPKPAPVVARPAPKPTPVVKPAAPKPPTEPTAAAPTPTEPVTEPKPPTDVKPPAEPKPPAVETKPAEPKPPAEPKAPPAPKPKPESEDNPY